ncbi:MAG: sigma-70 family RNA polymerase sigma factor, partial [Betaproteobacteria bacterium]
MHALASPTPSPLPPREAARRLAPSGHAGIDLLRWAQIARGRFRLTSHSSDARTAVSARPVGAVSRDRHSERDAQLVALLQAAASGNATAFESVYDLTVAYAEALARRMLPSADVDDVVADAYFQAWRDARQFDAERGSPVTWLLTILRSRALDLLRHRKASPEVVAGDEDTSHACEAAGPPDLLASVEAHSRLHRALSALSAQERWVLGLAYYRELSHREVSEQTGLPLGSVKSL